MHVQHVAATPTASCVPLLLLGLLLLTPGSDMRWGVEGAEGGGDGTAGDSLQLSVAGRVLREGTSELCDSARLHCTVRTGCQMALNNFFRGCHSILTGERQQCTTACQHALVSLLTTEDGAGLAFIHCNCSGHELCEDRKRRVQVCQRRVLDSMDLVRDHKAVLSCSLARWICEADTSCLAALQYYVQHCSKLFTGTRCTAKCRNSVHILYRQPNAHKLRTCRCEGDEDYDCPSLVSNTERLCLQRHRNHRNDSHPHHPRHHSQLHDYDDVIEGGSFRIPGRRTASSSSSSSQSSGQTSVAGQHPSGRTRRKRRNKPRRKKSKPRKNNTNKALVDKKGRRVLKRRAGQAQKGKGKGKAKNKGRRSRRRQCGGRKGRGNRKKRRSDKKGRPAGKTKRCPSTKKSAKQRSALLKKLRELTVAKRRVAGRKITTVP